MKKTLTHKISITTLPVCMRTLGGKKNSLNSPLKLSRGHSKFSNYGFELQFIHTNINTRTHTKVQYNTSS